MSLFIIVTVIQALVAAALVGVVLMQRSEGGGLGIGGNPSGALGARGAADFLSRSTKWLAVAFVGLSILLAALAVNETSISVETDLDRNVAAPTAEGLVNQPEEDVLAESGNEAAADSTSEESNDSDDLLAE